MGPARRQSTAATAALAALLAGVLLLSGCVHRIDIQQGNLLDEDAVEQIEPGMTRSQVRFLLGTPVVQSTFADNRWDYVYYLRKGRSRDVEQRWHAVHFDGDEVVRVERDLELNPERRGLLDFGG